MSDLKWYINKFCILVQVCYVWLIYKTKSKCSCHDMNWKWMKELRWIVVEIRGNISFFKLTSIRSIFTSSRSSGELLLVQMYLTQIFQHPGMVVKGRQQQTSISPEPGVKANRQWSQVGWILTHQRDGLLSSSFCSILDSSVGLWVGIESALDLMSQTSQLRILLLAEENNLSPFDSKTACLCQRDKQACVYVFMHIYIYIYI